MEVDKMKSYIYRLIVYKVVSRSEYGYTGIKAKAFLGNDQAALYEKFERWFIKQPLDREEIELSMQEVQHAGY